MATLYENYITGDDTFAAIYDARWRAQTFTPSIAHKITSVKLLLQRVGSTPGTLTVSIRATDVNGQPTGADLVSGSMDGNTINVPVALWYEITLGAGYNLVAATKYAIVVRAPSGDASNYINWRADGTSPTYADGNWEQSADSGATWSTFTSLDFMFEEWGDPISFIPRVFIM